MSLHQAAGLESQATAAKGRATAVAVETLGVLSGKGGVGKSTLAVNLSLALGRLGRPVLLVDADAGLANADLLLGQTIRSDLAGDGQGLTGSAGAVRSIQPGLDLLVLAKNGRGGAAVARAFASARAELAALRSRPGEIRLVDLGAGIGPEVLALAEACDRLWLVATPEPTSLADAYATAKRIWTRTPDRPIELIVNRADDRATAVRTHQALDRLTRRFLGRALTLRGVLPEDPAMLRAVAHQTPVLEHAPRAAITRRIEALAESVHDQFPILSA